jgi:nucleotide-binding universal stress UspA family protein
VPFRRILVPTDFSDHADEAARCALRLAQAFQAELAFVHVFDVSNLPIISAYPYYYGQLNQQMIDDMRTRAEAALEAFVERHAAQDRERKMVVGRPANQILEQARQWPAELIVMGTSGMGRVRELLGSVSHAVVRQAPCPVLTVRNYVEDGQ